MNTVRYLGWYTADDQIITLPERKQLRFLLPSGATLHIFCVEGGSSQITNLMILRVSFLQYVLLYIRESISLHYLSNYCHLSHCQVRGVTLIHLSHNEEPASYSTQHCEEPPSTITLHCKESPSCSTSHCGVTPYSDILPYTVFVNNS